MGITYDDVVGAIDALVGRGETPSIPKVRKELGDTGSPNTIQKHLLAWRSAAPVVSRVAIELPDTVKGAIIGAIERQSSLDRSEVDKKLLIATEELSLLAKTGEDLEFENEDLIEKNKVLAEENQKLSTLIDERTSKLKKTTDELQIERDFLEKSRVSQAENILKIEQLEKDLIIQSDENKNLNSELKKSKNDLIVSEKSLAVLESTSKRDEVDIKKLEGRLTDHIAKKDVTESELKLKISELIVKSEEKEKHLIQKFEDKSKELSDQFQDINQQLLNSKSEASSLKGRLTEIDKAKSEIKNIEKVKNNS
mgnify:FL=1